VKKSNPPGIIPAGPTCLPLPGRLYGEEKLVADGSLPTVDPDRNRNTRRRNRLDQDNRHTHRCESPGDSVLAPCRAAAAALQPGEVECFPRGRPRCNGMAVLVTESGERGALAPRPFFVWISWSKRRRRRWRRFGQKNAEGKWVATFDEAVTLADLRAMARTRGYRAGWVDHVIRARQNARGE
jgi:hypothetical protein